MKTYITKPRLFLLTVLAINLVFFCAVVLAQVTPGPWTRHFGAGTGAVLSTHDDQAACVAAVPSGQRNQCKTSTDVVKPASWVRVSVFNGTFNIVGTKYVRFGVGTSWRQRQMTGPGQWCTVPFFGGDPAPGQTKTCEQWTGATPPDPVPPPPVVNPPVVDMPSGYNPPAPLPVGGAGSGSILTSLTGEPVGPSDGTGNFRTNCDFSHMAYDDPIVFPGQPGRSHLHAFFGNKLTNANSTAASLATTGNSTCRGGILNRSAYWVPAMYDIVTGLAIAPKSSNFYYKSGYDGVRPQDIVPFPAGLRMIAGDPKNNNAGDIYGGNAWRFVCHDAAGQGISDMSSQSIPNCPAGSELWAQVFFPQCWNGVNLDSPDHKSHMAYANGSNPGGPGVARGCPASHPVALPGITFNIAYPVTAANQPRNWRLVTDTYTGPAGYSMHGDWWDGWMRDGVETFTARCINTAGDCHSHLLGDGRAIH